MSQQPDLLGPQPLVITPATGMTGPRLWVRRLVIWGEPGGEKIRDIPLRPGLNIIWSPDGADDTSGEQNDAIGHGSGKTLFSRLIRYCLGEDRFATEAQRERIGVAFLNGIVGAEVILDGVCWAIVRPLGVRRRHMAVPNGNLEEIAAGEGASTGLEPFIDAVDQTLLTPALADLVRPRTDGPTWPVALAWLTRDQECRFDDVLDWRSPASDSDSPMPASGREKGPRLEALRAFLMAITPEEQQLRTEVSKLDEQRRALEQEAGHRHWTIERNQTRLVSALSLSDQTLPEMPLLLDLMRKAAGEHVAAATQLPAGSKTELAIAREDFEAARTEWARLDGERIRIEASLPIEERVLSQIKGDLPGLSFSTVEAESQVCPICEVPIDRAIAEKCGLSDKLHDPDACRARWEKRQQEFQEQEQKLTTLRRDKTNVLQQLALAKQAIDQRATRVASIEKARDARETAWYSARRLQDDVDRLVDLVSTQELATKDLRELTTKLETKRNRLGAFRDKQARTFGRMSEKFDPIIRRVVGHDAKSRTTLSHNSIDLSVDMGGDRTTAAIESLKVLAFDLAALCLSIEGVTRIPAFFLHDSPREADLGLSIYHELFRLVREIEEQTDQPLFQYIVTTTTRPPQDLASEPWLRLTLRGAPGNERLLRCDL
ncbi:chromosome segregation protein SMC [Tistrella mobilis]|uniref:chromosome segregation protein SMC n=1 Tax=Tistrella mobilis TaxID=171437 RepID=UPI0035562728